MVGRGGGGEGTRPEGGGVACLDALAVKVVVLVGLGVQEPRVPLLVHEEVREVNLAGGGGGHLRGGGYHEDGNAVVGHGYDPKVNETAAGRAPLADLPS